ncbi:MAG: hypothetical protein ACYC5W_01455 [Thauera sp.]
MTFFIMSTENNPNPVALDDDLDRPPPYWKPTKLERLLPHLGRIEKAQRLGWRMADIQAKLTAELDLGEMKPSAFSMLVTNARRRAAAQAATPAVSAAPAPATQAAPAVQAVPAPVAPAAPTISTAPPAPAPARSVDEKMALLRADHARRAAAQAAELAAESGSVAPVAVAVAPAPAPVAVPAPAVAAAAPAAPAVRAAPVPAPAQKPTPAASGTLTRSEKLAQMRALQLAAPEPTDPSLIAALRVRKGWLRPDSSIVDKAAVEGLKKLGVLLCPPPDADKRSATVKQINEVATEYLKAVPQARLLIEESVVEHQASWDPDKVYVERTDADIHEEMVTAIKTANADRLRAARAKASAGISSWIAIE